MSAFSSTGVGFGRGSWLRIVLVSDSRKVQRGIGDMSKTVSGGLNRVSIAADQWLFDA